MAENKKLTTLLEAKNKTKQESEQLKLAVSKISLLRDSYKLMLPKIDVYAGNK